MNTQQINKLVADAYSRLDGLNNFSWTSHREKCFRLALQEERSHMRGAPDGFRRPKGYSKAGAARMFVVHRIAQYLESNVLPGIESVLDYQPSAVYAAALVAKYHVEIHQMWGMDRQLIAQLANLDYCEYAGSK